MGLLLGGIFQCDPSCAPRTFHGWAHILTSIPATLAALAGPFVLARRLEGDPRWRPLARPSRAFGWLSIATIAAAFFAFPRCGIPGIGQRVATFAQLGWLSMLAGRLAFASPGSSAAAGGVASAGAAIPGRWPPGPSGLRALRYLGRRRELIPFTERCRREYGGICGIRLLGARICLISDPRLIERVFVHHASRIRKWDSGVFEPILGQGLLTSGGELWKRQRSLIQPVFAPARLGEYSEAILGHTQAMLDRWPQQGVLDVHAEMLRLSLKIAASALFGADSSAIEDRIAEVQDLLMKYFNDSLSGIPIPLGVPTPANLRTRRAIRQLDEVVLRLIAERRAAPRGRDLVGTLLSAQGADGGARLSDRQVRDECMTMLLAGHETTALVMTWTLWLLGRHPEAAEALRRELEAALPGGAPGLGEVERISELPLLANVLSESMRLYPPVWAIGRVSTQALDLGPYVLPQGTQIFLVPFLAHRDGEVFEAPLEFRPGRWDDPALRAIPRCSYLPFGAGPRKCVGMHFAVRESQLILAQIARRCRLEALPGEEPELQASVTLRPARGLRLKVSKA